MLEKTGRLPTIPEYYKEMINRSVDLLENPKQCCPFHTEDTPSFSYSAERGKWRCFGGCKCGGDVIDLHRKNYRLATRQDAERSLNALCGIVKRVEIYKENVNLYVSENKVEQEEIYQKAILLANCPDKWVELDYFMSKTPIDLMGLTDLVNKWCS